MHLDTRGGQRASPERGACHPCSHSDQDPGSNPRCHLGPSEHGRPSSRAELLDAASCGPTHHTSIEQHKCGWISGHLVMPALLCELPLISRHRPHAPPTAIQRHSHVCGLFPCPAQGATGTSPRVREAKEEQDGGWNHSADPSDLPCWPPPAGPPRWPSGGWPQLPRGTAPPASAR